MQITTLILIFAVGVAFAVFTVYYNSRFVGKFVRALLDIDALSPENAMSPDELGIKDSPLMRFALRPNSSLSTMVGRTDDGKYYILEEKSALARRKYRDQHVTIFYVLLLIFIALVFAIVAAYVFPELQDFIRERGNELFGSD